jgi:hypothetical protein
MTSVVTTKDSKVVCIAGLGISVPGDFELAPGIMIRPNPPRFEVKAVADGCETLADYSAILAMMEVASFYIEIQDEAGGKELVVKAWNSLWLFPLLALACHRPCASLYSWCEGQMVVFAVATPHTTIRKPAAPLLASGDQLAWARKNLAYFDALQKDRTFTTALMSYTNSHHLFGHNSRIMQLWSGIECLFKVSNEISRTLAMYSALLIEEGDPNERYKLFKAIKKDYGVRSQVVHGTVPEGVELEAAHSRASDLLAKLLSRCVELSRVPSTEELDRAALVGSITPNAPEPPQSEAGSPNHKEP